MEQIHVTNAKRWNTLNGRGKTHNECQARENMTNLKRGKNSTLLTDRLVSIYLTRENNKCSSQSRLWWWLEMFSDSSLPHWNMLTWWLSPSNNSLGLLFRPCKTNVAVTKMTPQKKQSQETIVWRLFSIQRKFSIKNASQRSGHPDLYSSSKSSEKYLMARTVQNQGGGSSGGELEG